LNARLRTLVLDGVCCSSGVGAPRSTQRKPQLVTS